MSESTPRFGSESSWLHRLKPEHGSPGGVLYSTMRLRPVFLVVALAALHGLPALGQGRTIDEGTFLVTRTGTPTQTESFRIVRLDNGLIQATAQLSAGDERISSSLLTDSLGTPLTYQYFDKNRGVTTFEVRALAGGKRLSLKASDNRSNESMRDFPIAPGQCVILDDGFVHQLYFVALTKRTGALQIIVPHRARRESAFLSGRGFDPVEVAGRSVTATHFSLVTGSMAREFWIDAAGRVLKVEIPTLGLTAVREDLP